MYKFVNMYNSTKQTRIYVVGVHGNLNNIELICVLNCKLYFILSSTGEIIKK